MLKFIKSIQNRLTEIKELIRDENSELKFKLSNTQSDIKYEMDSVDKRLIRIECRIKGLETSSKLETCSNEQIAVEIERRFYNYDNVSVQTLKYHSPKMYAQLREHFYDEMKQSLKQMKEVK